METIPVAPELPAGVGRTKEEPTAALLEATSGDDPTGGADAVASAAVTGQIVVDTAMITVVTSPTLQSVAVASQESMMDELVEYTVLVV